MESREMYRQLFENSKEAIFILTPDGRMIDVNPACVELFGFASEDEMRSLNVTALYPSAADREIILRQFAEVGYVKDFRMELRRRDGKRLDVIVNATVLRDENGHVVAHQGILHDITDRGRAEKVLAESEERLKRTLDAAHMVAWEIGADGTHREVGPVHELFGRPAGFRHATVTDLFGSIHPEDRKELESLVEDTLAGRREEYTAEFRIPQADGPVRWVKATGTLQRDAGTPARILGIAHDITPRKRAEEGRRASEDRIRSLVQSLPMGMYLYHLEEDGRLVFTGANPAADRIVGTDHTRLIGRTIEEAFPGLAATEVPERYRKVARDGEMWHTDQIDYDRDGIRGAYEVYAFQTSPGNMAVVFEEITERMRMHEALRRSEERLQRMLQNSNDIIGLIDENGVQISLSGPVEKILGCTPEELTGKDTFSRIHPDDAENVKKSFRDILGQPGSSRSVEYRIRHKNGNWISVESVGSNLLHNPAVRAVVVNTREITERKKLQEQLQQAMKMEAVGRLAGGIAHDFNNILTVIAGNIELARMALSPSDPLYRSLDQVARAADSAASLTRQLLAFSRKQIIEPKVLDLNDLVGNVRQMLGRLIGENVTLETALQEGLSSVKADPGQFEQVLVNLAVNARDAMPEGGKLTIETADVTLDESYCATHPYAQAGPHVLLALSDTGLGMSGEVKAHLFEPFFTTKGKGHGTGLGLATTFGIVKQAGGAIEVYSEIGRGTTFKIYLPAVEERAEKLTREGRPVDMLRGGETILLVEDEESVRKVALTILQSLGYRVIEARDGEEALMLAEKHPGKIDLLMTDIVMPGINGRELSERISVLRPETKTLFTSGYTENVIVHHGLLESHLNFIGKPYSVQALAGKIREVLGPARR